MKKRMTALLLVGLLLISPLILAQEQVQTYSNFDRFSDNVEMLLISKDNKVKLALEIREKEIDSAINNVQNEKEDKAIKNIEKAKKRLQFVQEEVSLGTVEDVKVSVEEITNKINNGENLPDGFDEYLLEEEKTHLTAELTEKTYEYCSELAKEDFALMLKDEECNPKTAPEPLKKDLEKLKDLQERMFVKLMLEIRSCIDDPGTCNCENNFEDEEKIKCEKMVTLALKCEYQDNEGACNELNSLNALKAESFVPDFLMNLFRAKKEQMLWGETPSDCVPEECWDENDKPECRQYDKFKETEKDWDEYGNFIGTKNKCGKEGSIPTMRESIPQCFDNDVFLEEKCGKITMIENEDGLVNYIIENEVNGILGKIENKSRQYAPGTSANGTMDINKTAQHPIEIREGWMMVDNEWVVDGGSQGIKQEMNQIKEQIAERTFAPGTFDTGDSTNDIKKVVIKEGKEGSGDGGLKPEIKTDVAKGDGGLKQEVKNYVAGDGTEMNDPLPTPDFSETHYDPSQDEVITHNIDNPTVDSGVMDVDEGDNYIDTPSMDKDNEDVTPTPNVVDNTVDEGPGEPGVIDD